ncbi:hypothetical protein N7519_000862 [Penicillium mononematosum]|uniref:uncharacterized protein n=1 Tax=Penicillium mononematosum TaxID=268346 RepID=UPI00254790C8|nr:uncharacterized protein N7519_000862 [Penicillium mononematosum]KAJ6190841.1 hypothetical protein N7519_000862 [Penicillium mononematosum]
MKDPSKTSRGPQCRFETVELPNASRQMVEISNRYLLLSTLNEAATRCIIKAILFAILDEVAPVQTLAPGL